MACRFETWSIDRQRAMERLIRDPVVVDDFMACLHRQGILQSDSLSTGLTQGQAAVFHHVLPLV